MYGRRSIGVQDDAEVYRAVITVTYPADHFIPYLAGTTTVVAVGPYVKPGPAKAAITEAKSSAERARRYARDMGDEDRAHTVEGRVERGRTTWEPIE